MALYESDENDLRETCGSWTAQTVQQQALDFNSGSDLRVKRLSLPAWNSLSPSRSAPCFLLCTLSPSLFLKNKN